MAEKKWGEVAGALAAFGAFGGLMYYAVRKDREHEALLARRLEALRLREEERRRVQILEGLRGLVHEEVQAAVEEVAADLNRRQEERERGRDLRAQVREQERDSRAAARDAERDRRNKAAEDERDRRNKAAEADREKRAREVEAARATTAARGWAQQQRELAQQVEAQFAENERRFQELFAQAEQLLRRPSTPSGPPGSVNDRIRKLHDDD